MNTYLFIALVGMTIERAEGLTCLQCKGIPSPRICNKVVDCYISESCSLEQVRNEFGETVYNQGCLSNSVCNNFTNSINGQAVACSECCNKADLCNSKGCQQDGYPGHRGPICYNCPLHTDSGKCHDIEFCSNGEVCNIVGKNIFSESVYTSSCQSQHACKPVESNHVAIIGKRDIIMDKRNHEQHICDSCCTKDLCNKNCTTAQASIDPCQSNPCNNGSCKSDGHYFRCECSAGFSGTVCDQVDDPCQQNPCNNGSCKSDGHNFKCECSAGFGGTACSKVLTDCADILRYGKNVGDGIYTIVTWKTHESIDVYCDMTTDGGGWTVFQYRFNGSVDFYRNFSQYENGFGNLITEFWLGLKYIEEIANQGPTDLRIDLEAADGTKAFETFDKFSLSPGPAFTLHLGSTIDSLHIKNDNNHNFGQYHIGSSFSTYDNDADTSVRECSVMFHGAWWYADCYHANLNGKYITPGAFNNNNDQMTYQSFRALESLKKSKMMIRILT